MFHRYNITHILYEAVKELFIDFVKKKKKMADRVKLTEHYKKI
jgi:hypothetical protein